MSTKTQCQHSGSNHSTDMVAVYMGSAAPVMLCGYHNHSRMMADNLKHEG